MLALGMDILQLTEAINTIKTPNIIKKQNSKINTYWNYFLDAFPPNFVNNTYTRRFWIVAADCTPKIKQMKVVGHLFKTEIEVTVILVILRITT